MPILYVVKEGRIPRTQSDEGLRLSIDEVRANFGNCNMKYVSKEPPEFNPDTPTRHKHVVIEVKDAEDIGNEFPKIGFYVVQGPSLDMAQNLFSQRNAKR